MGEAHCYVELAEGNEVRKSIGVAALLCMVIGCAASTGEAPASDSRGSGGESGDPGVGATGGTGAGGEDGSLGSGGTLGDGGGAMFVADLERYIVMEVESVSIPSGHEWVADNSLADFNGSGYYRFVGNGICNGPAGSPLRYVFEIRAPARYELRLRAAKVAHCVAGAPQGNGTCTEHDRTCSSLGEPIDGSCGDPGQCIRNDISNDAFVYIEASDGEYVPFVDQPSGSIGEPIKLFGGQPNAWAWTGKRALDRSGKWDAHWDLDAGVYTLVLQGRSRAFRIDRIALFDSETGSASGATDRGETR